MGPDEGISIYIDETWPGLQDHSQRDVGVIGGIVIPDKLIRAGVLPPIGTHLGPSAAEAAIVRMLSIPGVFPFVLPIRVKRGKSAVRQYTELVKHAILLLLGWILPRPGCRTGVSVFIEHIGDLVDGHDETDFFMGLSSAMGMLSGVGRFSNWMIDGVSWQDKDFEYVPYGDLVCKTCVPLRRQQQLARDVRRDEWDGYQPFSVDLFPSLLALDSASPSGFADALLVCAGELQRTKLFGKIVAQAVGRAKLDDSFRNALLDGFEECYSRKGRNTSLLNRLIRPFLAAFPPGDFVRNPRTMALRMLLELQNANHTGDPEAANALVADFTGWRRRLMQIDRELCAEIDMHRIVHHHDLLEFDAALTISDEWFADPAFPSLSLAGRGKMLSSRGQTLAMTGRHDEAERNFSEALETFRQEREFYRAEIDQTSVYIAMNRLDRDPQAAVEAVERALGASLGEVAADPFRHLQNPYHEHLFLKTLWLLRSVRNAEALTYLDARFSWPVTYDHHPHELILFYRTMLMHASGMNGCKGCADELEQLFERMDYGGIIGLIHAYIRVTLKRLGLGSTDEKSFAEELEIVSGYIPAASRRVEKLSAAWHDRSVDIEDVLGFNYR